MIMALTNACPAGKMAPANVTPVGIACRRPDACFHFRCSMKDDSTIDFSKDRDGSPGNCTHV
jgi:hypothetical protein